MSKGYFMLVASTISVAFFHALAPDHWMPFAMMAKAQKWSRAKLFLITFVSGLAHVGSSILFGSIGILAGVTVSRLEGIEGHKGSIALWLLIGFGIAYAVWGLKKAKGHEHGHFDEHDSRQKTTTIWALFAIFVLGPCEPLIPIMFLATKYGFLGIWSASLAFSFITVAMMLVQSFLALLGVELIKGRIAEKYAHTIAGIVIALTGALVILLGI